MTELLVTLSMRFPAAVDEYTLSAVLTPVVRAAVAAGGLTTNLSVQPYEPSPGELPDSHSSSHPTGEEGASPNSPLRPVAPHGGSLPCGSDRV